MFRVFQFTAPRRSWRDIIFYFGAFFWFQFTAPRRSWHSWPRLDPKRSNFNSQLHAGADKASINTVTLKSYFNSQLHAGADEKITEAYNTAYISIHSSTQELTGSTDDTMVTITISIHSSTQELTERFLWLGQGENHFNSQLHAGADGGDRCWVCKIYNFNSQLHAGADKRKPDAPPQEYISIHSSTQELTKPNTVKTADGTISIHSSTQELTLHTEEYDFRERISIHSSTQELTRDCIPTIYDVDISIHSSTQELTVFLVLFPSSHFYFNSQLHAGADLSRRKTGRPLWYFNSQLHAGADKIGKC